jgi:hypothetical protein
MFLVLWKCTYSCTQSISAGRCGNHGSPSEPRSEIHMVHSRRFTSRERSHSFPHRGTAATLLPFLSSPCAWSGVCHVSQMRGSHSQIPMWLPCPDPEPHSSHRKAPSIRHVRRSSPCHCSPLFPFLTFHISRSNTSMRPPGFILPTLTEILFSSLLLSCDNNPFRP